MQYHVAAPASQYIVLSTIFQEVTVILGIVSCNGNYIALHRVLLSHNISAICLFSFLYQLNEYTGRDVFYVLTSAGPRGSCLNTKPQGRIFKFLPRGPTNVYAFKQPCVVVILAFHMIP